MTTRKTGGMHLVYKAIMLAAPQGAPKWFANRIFFTGCPTKWGGLLLARFYRLTRERIYIFLQTYLVTCDIFLYITGSFLYTENGKLNPGDVDIRSICGYNV